MTLEAQIEGILFYAGRPLSYKELAAATHAPEAEVQAACQNLSTSLAGRGVSLLIHEGDVTLVTIAELAPVIEAMRRDELRRDIGKAGAETLAIIAYLGSATRAEIDFIRGVNSTFILRNLMIRGLIERTEQKGDRRSFAYQPTIELFAYLGITRKEDLPQYAEMTEAVAAYREEAEARSAAEDGEETRV